MKMSLVVSLAAVAALMSNVASSEEMILNCSGRTIFYEKGEVKSNREWTGEIIIIDTIKKTVRHNAEPEGPTITSISRSHITWSQRATLITEGWLDRINGKAEERMTTSVPGWLAVNYFEICEKSPGARF
ncbi:MAG: hypothetical protein Q8M31_21290 [Beijerinckiaceae bacterium]|nr:hypothetical protein [Beijerinckiaceae bacterium]